VFAYQQDDGNRGRLRIGFQALDKLTAVHHRHHQVAKNNVWPQAAYFDKVERFPPIGCRFRDKAALFQKTANRMADEHGVIHYQRQSSHSNTPLGEKAR